MERVRHSVIVIGAGIGGLTAALCFARRGFSVEIFERSRRLSEAGAGLQLSPNALRVLAELGLMPSLEPLACSADAVTLRSGRSGRPIARVPVRSDDGTPYLSIHRADLQASLLAEVRRTPGIVLSLGAEFLSLAAGTGGENEIAVSFSLHGRESHPSLATLERRSPIVIAADGVRSGVARALGHAGPSPARDVAWRMTLAAPSSKHSTSGIEAWLGSHRHAVAYPVRGGSLVNLVLIEPGGDTDAAGGKHEPPADAKARLLHRFRRWDPRLREMIGAAGPATAWPLLALSGKRISTRPATPLLIGDAAHAMLPYAAQGAAMAIEDAWTAAEAYATAENPTSAAALFHGCRDARLQRVRRRVAFHRLVYHLPFPLSLARNAALRLRSQEALARDLGWLYDWRPEPF